MAQQREPVTAGGLLTRSLAGGTVVDSDLEVRCGGCGMRTGLDESGHRMSGADPMYDSCGCGRQLARVVMAADGCYRFESFNNAEVFARFR